MIKVTTVDNVNAVRRVEVRLEDSNYILPVYTVQQLNNLIDDLCHHKWLWETQVKEGAPSFNLRPTLPRPAMLEDDEADVNDFMHGTGEAN